MKLEFHCHAFRDGALCQPVGIALTIAVGPASIETPKKCSNVFAVSGIYNSVRTILKLLAGLFSSAWPGISAHAAHTQVQLILSADTARPGDTIWAGVDMKMEPDWHTYWKNPGEAGMATKIEWQLPPGVTAGEIQWPLPEKLPPAEVTTYGYNNEVMLLVPLKLAADLKPGPLDLKAKVSWLECKEECIPGSASGRSATEHRQRNQNFRRCRDD